jgi:hypothetical protein
MKKCIYLLLALCCHQVMLAQVQRMNGLGEKMGEVNVAALDSIDLNPQIVNYDVHPLPSAGYGNLKALRRLQRMNMGNNTTPSKLRGDAPNPIIVKGLTANTAQGIPLDNDIAVANNGNIMSCVNSNIKLWNDTLKATLNFRSLTSMVAALGNFTWISDPRSLYDPVSDRFVMTFFSGSDSWESSIFVGFSKSNKPDSTWNFYKLNGNSFNDSTWSDYPIIALNDKDVFITYNQVKDNVSWQVGFKQSVIWQIDKASGINGAATLPFTLWSNLKLGDSMYRNICPAKPQVAPFGNDMYFVSVRNVALSNDSVFLFHIDNSQQSGLAQLSTSFLKSNINYGFPPNVPLRDYQELMTNDGRVLAAIYTNNKIFFGANSINPAFNNAAVYLSTISNVTGANPSVTGKMVSNAKQEFGYPSMCYLGNGNANDDRVLWTFSHCYTDSFAGCSMLYQNAQGQYSDIISLKDGLTNVNVLSDSTERWGDYSGVQRKFNTAGTAYLANSYSNQSGLRAWIAKIENAEFAVSNSDYPSVLQDVQVYPNPSVAHIRIDFSLQTRTKVNIALYNVQGQLLIQLPNDYLKAGNQSLYLNTAHLKQGMYIVKGTSSEGVLFSKEFIKE